MATLPTRSHGAYKKVVGFKIPRTMKLTLLYVVCGNKREATTIGRGLVRQRLAACVNIWPISSYYVWQRQLTNSRETVLLVKTSKKLVLRAVAYIQSHHSYDAPAILKLPAVSHDRNYSNWFHGILSEKKGT